MARNHPVCKKATALFFSIALAVLLNACAGRGNQGNFDSPGNPFEPATNPDAAITPPFSSLDQPAASSAVFWQTAKAATEDEPESVVCYHNFPEIRGNRLIKLLHDSPRIKDLNRKTSLSSAHYDCHCYTFRTTMGKMSLADWLGKNLRTGRILDFRIKQGKEKLIDLYFDGGFR